MIKSSRILSMIIMLFVTCASWADDGFGDPLEGKWSTESGDIYFHVEDGKAVVTNKNASETGSTSGGESYRGIVKIPTSIEFLGATIPVVGIQDYAFYNCPELTDVIIPSSITKIGNAAFASTPALETITVDNANKYFRSADGILFDKSAKELIAVPAAMTFTDNKYSIPSSITKVWNYAFDGCITITNISLPSSLDEIEFYAFNNCTNLETINIPSGLSILGDYAFNNCSDLNIDFVLPSKMNKIPQGLFNNCRKMSKVALSNAITEIGAEAFYGCTSLTSISLPSSLTTMGTKAFANTGISSIEIPGNLEVIPNLAFYGTKLTSITINEGVKEIGKSAFANTGKSIVSVVFPKSLEKIGDYAFQKTNVNNFYVQNRAEMVSVSDNTPFQKISSLKIHVGKGLVNEFKNTNNWKYYAPYIVGDLEDQLTTSDIVTLIDGIDYTYSTDRAVKKVIYSRIYKDSKWQPLYLPFDMKYEDWKDNFEVAVINNIHQYDDDDNGTIDRTLIEVLKLKAGKTLKANTPCVIKALNPSTKAQEITVEDVTLKKAESKTLDCSSVNTMFLFKGIYSLMNGDELVAGNYYAMANGGFRATTATDKLKGYRWCFQMIDRASNAKSGNSKLSFICPEEDEEATGINAAEQTTSNEIIGIYNANGHKQNGLMKGLNIVKFANGSIKKIMK